MKEEKNRSPETIEEMVKGSAAIFREQESEKMIREYVASRKRRRAELINRYRLPKTPPSSKLMSNIRRNREAKEKIYNTILSDEVIKEYFGAFSDKTHDYGKRRR